MQKITRKSCSTLRKITADTEVKLRSITESRKLLPSQVIWSYTKRNMKNTVPINRNGGASIAIVILAILGMVFLAQYFGYDVRTYWPILAIIIVVVFILGGGKS